MYTHLYVDTVDNYYYTTVYIVHRYDAIPYPCLLENNSLSLHIPHGCLSLATKHIDPWKVAPHLHGRKQKAGNLLVFSAASQSDLPWNMENMECFSNSFGYCWVIYYDLESIHKRWDCRIVGSKLGLFRHPLKVSFTNDTVDFWDLECLKKRFFFQRNKSK